jgi:transcriptional regulator with XRE-family HTH domain
MKISNYDSTSLNYEDIGFRISHLRNDILHMTQADFSSALDISQTYLSMIENGKKQIQQPILDKILITFKVSIEWLLFGMGDDILLSDDMAGDFIKKKSQDSTLSDLKQYYGLRQDEYAFIKWLLSLPSSERRQFVSSINSIFDLSPKSPGSSD